MKTYNIDTYATDAMQNHYEREIMWNDGKDFEEVSEGKVIVLNDWWAEEAKAASNEIRAMLMNCGVKMNSTKASTGSCYITFSLNETHVTIRISDHARPFIPGDDAENMMVQVEDELFLNVLNDDSLQMVKNFIQIELA